jgi:hypothetical protein
MQESLLMLRIFSRLIPLKKVLKALTPNLQQKKQKLKLILLEDSHAGFIISEKI